MTQNRNKLINLLVGNVSNSIVHEILEKATKNEDLIKDMIKNLQIVLI